MTPLFESLPFPTFRLIPETPSGTIRMDEVSTHEAMQVEWLTRRDIPSPSAQAQLGLHQIIEANEDVGL